MNKLGSDEDEAQLTCCASTTSDMLCCIQNVIEKTILMSERTFIVFIDYSKAFDSVSHIQMFNILNNMGFPRHIVALIQALYEKQSAIVTLERITHQAFLHREGRTARMHSIPTALLCLHGASTERGQDNRIRRRYWRKINIKFTVRR